ncbi:MAG: toprim domain-containing protein [Paraclostridium sp.]
MSKKDYSADSIKSVDGIEHIRMYPGMYLKDSGELCIQQTVKEIVTNSTDEFLQGYGNVIEVELSKDNVISIKDHARGIPTGVNKTTGLTGVEMCVGDTQSGGKYDKDSYKISGGLFGIGAAASNAVSEKFEVWVKRDGKIHYCKYEHGRKVHPKKPGELEIVGKCNIDDTGTEIKYSPDPTILETTNFSVSSIMHYLKHLSYLIRGLTFKFIDSRDPDNVKVESYSTDNGLVDYINDTIKDGRKSILTKPIYFKGKFENDDEYEVAFTYVDNYASDVLLYVNKNAVSNGGTAITGFKTGLTKSINDISKLLGIMKDKEKPLRSQDTEEGLVAIVSVLMKSPQLEGQTKNKLNNSNMVGLVSSASTEFLSGYFENNPLVIGRISEKCLLGRRAREAAQRARALIVEKSVSKFSGPSKLKDCKSRDARLNELMIVEGDSASSGLSYGRDVNTQAYLPLRGKVLNVEKVLGMDEALKNNEIRDITNVIGCGYGNDFDITKLRYHKIIIMTDADPDGLHIACLLMTFFYRFLKPLVEGGHIFICVPPLFRVKWGRDKEEFFNTVDELEEWKAINIVSGKIKDFTISRFKGLGEMKPEELGERCVDPSNRTLIQVTLNEAQLADEVIRKLMGSETVGDRKKFFQSKGEII